MKKIFAMVAAATMALSIFLVAGEAVAADSVSVLGQVGVEQCPSGFQYNTGISVNATTGVVTTICNAPPNQLDLLTRQQDADFQAQIDSAVASATAQSQAWNAANPGMQRCVSWGPITHANGVGQSSGGVCANPVSAGEGTTVPQAPSAEVVATVPGLTPNQNIVGNGQPFTVSVPGQVAAGDCPVGYQAANGLSVDVSTGLETTECWAPDAWAAYRLGGIAWEKFNATGGGYDVAAEVDRLAKLEDLKNQALAVAQLAADQTPGVRRCSNWSGYNETGIQCAYSFVSPVASSDVSEEGGAAEMPMASEPPSTAPVLAAASITSAAFVALPKIVKATVTAKSRTPLVCKVVKAKVVKLKPGVCVLNQSVAKAKTKTSISKRVIVFAR